MAGNLFLQIMMMSRLTFLQKCHHYHFIPLDILLPCCRKQCLAWWVSFPRLHWHLTDKIGLWLTPSVLLCIITSKASWDITCIHYTLAQQCLMRWEIKPFSASSLRLGMAYLHHCTRSNKRIHNRLNYVLQIMCISWVKLFVQWHKKTRIMLFGNGGYG